MSRRVLSCTVSPTPSVSSRQQRVHETFARALALCPTAAHGSANSELQAGKAAAIRVTQGVPRSVELRQTVVMATREDRVEESSPPRRWRKLATRASDQASQNRGRIFQRVTRFNTKMGALERAGGPARKYKYKTGVPYSRHVYLRSQLFSGFARRTTGSPSPWAKKNETRERNKKTRGRTTC